MHNGIRFKLKIIYTLNILFELVGAGLSDIIIQLHIV